MRVGKKRLCNYGEGEEGGGWEKNWDVCVQMRVRERGVCGMDKNMM